MGASLGESPEGGFMRRIVPVLIVLVGLGFVACGGSSGGGGGSAMSVALFIDDNYIDYVADPMYDGGDEGYNVLFHLQYEGLSYTTISGVTSTEFSTALQGRDALIIPEQEVDILAPDLNAAAQSVISDFVEGGGTLICMYTDSYALSLVNMIFGYSMEEGGIEKPILYNDTDAAGTRFDGGREMLGEADATTSVLGSTLPVGAMSMYLDSNGDSVVTVIEEGSGEIILLGYDWYDAMPYGVQDGGWVEILNRSLDNY